MLVVKPVLLMVTKSMFRFYCSPGLIGQIHEIPLAKSMLPKRTEEIALPTKALPTKVTGFLAVFSRWV